MIRITHPRPQPGRVRFLGVEFIDGVAEVAELHPIREQALLQHGHTIEKPIVGVPLFDLSARELREVAEFEGIDVPKRAKKADIIAALISAGMHEEIDLEQESRREFLAAHIVPLGPDED